MRPLTLLKTSMLHASKEIALKQPNLILGQVCGIFIMPMQTIYPEKNLHIRPAYHKVVLPREEQITVYRPFSIMWTQVATMPENRPSSPRCPNTVPCVPAKSTVLLTVPMTYAEVVGKKPCSAHHKVQSSQRKLDSYHVNVLPTQAQL